MTDTRCDKISPTVVYTLTDPPTPVGGDLATWRQSATPARGNARDQNVLSEVVSRQYIHSITDTTPALPIPPTPTPISYLLSVIPRPPTSPSPSKLSFLSPPSSLLLLSTPTLFFQHLLRNLHIFSEGLSANSLCSARSIRRCCPPASTTV